MASSFNFETRDERIERMIKDNPNRSVEMCTVVVDGIWEEKSKIIANRIPVRFKHASIVDLGYLTDVVLQGVETILESPQKNNKVGLIFCGPVGGGKTHAMYSVINELNDRNPEAVAFITTYGEIFLDLKKEFFNDEYQDIGSTWDKLSNASGMYDGILFLDDVSSQHPTDFELEKLTMFLEKRFNLYLPFVLTTNIKPEDFVKIFGERLASRLFGYCEIIEFNERDKRLDSNAI